MSIELVMLSNCLFLYRLHLLLPLIFLGIRIISNEMALCISWPKYWSVSFGISPSNEYSGLISFRVDWFDVFDVLGLTTVFSSTTVQKHQFFSTQTSLWSSSHWCHEESDTTEWLSLSRTSIHDYWKNHSFDYMDLFRKVMSLLFNICLGLSEFSCQGACFNFMATLTTCSV